MERIGDECRANDIPFFLELVGYEEGADEKGLEFAKKKPKIVKDSMAEFTKDKYGVDVLKVEVPINMKFVEGAKSFGGQKAYTRKEAMQLFLDAATAATKPFIYLSAGVSNAEFNESLALGRRKRRQVQRRALWPRHLEGWHPDLRREGRAGLPRVAEDGWREEHRKRQQEPAGRNFVVCALRSCTDTSTLDLACETRVS